MSVTEQPWFYAESLRMQFSRDVSDALAAERINEKIASWLQSLVSEEQGDTVLPRVDRLSREDGGLMNAELAGALLISDPIGITTDIYLHTPLYGLECFHNRQQLVTQLTARFAQQAGDPKQFEDEQINGNVFESSMLSIVDQQVHQLQRLNEGLHSLPTLHGALGQTLEQQLGTQLPQVSVDVFTHLALIAQVDSGIEKGPILGSQTLVEVALNRFSNTALPEGVRQQLLDTQGRQLTDDQAKPWQQALASVSSAVVGVYEQLLTDFWGTQASHDLTSRDLLCQVFTERFRLAVLEHRHQASLSADECAALRSLCESGDGWSSEIRLSKLSVVIGTQDPIKLAGIVLIDFISEQLPGLLVYSAEKRLQRFTSLAAVTEHFSGIDGRTQLFSHSSLNDHPLLRTPGVLHLRLDALERAPMAHVVESVIALQKRNLGNILKEAFKSPAEAAVKVAHAMDIRSLIDSRLLNAGGRGPWDETMASAERDWSAFSSPSRIAALGIRFGKDSGELATLPWAVWLRDVRGRVERIFEARPTAVECARQLLNRHLAVLHSDAIDAKRMWFHGEDDKVVSLSVLLLERLTGHRTGDISPDCYVYVDPVDSMYAQGLSWLTPQVLNHVMNAAQRDFAREYSEALQAFDVTRLQRGSTGIVPANASRLIREGLLRLELNMHRNSSKISGAGLNMLQQVLDRPVFSLRETLDADATEVYVPFLVHDSNQPDVPLTNVMILQQPLKGDGRPLMWSAVLGLCEFDSLAELQLDLRTRVVFAGSQDRWLDLVAKPDRKKIRTYLNQSATHQLTLRLARVEEHFLERLEQDELKRQCLDIEAAYERAVDWKADFKLLENKLALVERDDRTRTIIDTVSGQIELTLLSWHLPDWLKDSPVQDLIKFRELLVRFGQLFNSRQPIPQLFSLVEYSADQLLQRLQTDFSGVSLDPGRITVTLTRYTVAPVGVGETPSSIPAATNVISESLTHYAINRFSDFQDATLSLSSEDATSLPVALDAAYVRTLVQTLDIGARYEQYLNQVFSETQPDYAERLEQFMQQAPYAMQLMAFELKMQGLLSDTAFDFIENITGMPDGLARLNVNEQAVTFSPLGLVAAEGYAADIVAGVFVIAPADQAKGPWILHAVASAQFLFKEYPGKNELLNDLYTSSSLQALVLERLDPGVRFIYERDGFMQPHLSWATGGYTGLSASRPGPVQLRIEAVKGNLLHSLFHASQQVMLIIARKNSVTTAQDSLAASRFLLLLGFEQVLMFLPGRVGGLVGLWQAQDLLDASLGAASDDKWGRATAEFGAALAVLISSRQQSEDITEQIQRESGVVVQPIAPRWHDPQLQFDLEGRLQPFEVRDVSLSDMQWDEAGNLFRDLTTLRQYAAIFGKVYRVKKGLDGWYVIDGNREGPRVTLDTDRHWMLDTGLGQRRNGGALTRLRSAQTEDAVSDILLVQGRGVPEIQRLYPHKARDIAEAHGRARFYLENALDNLIASGPQGALDARTARIITDFFGVTSINNVALVPIKEALIGIYSLLLDPSLSPHSSLRYVAGTNKLGREHSSAFTFARDPLRRIFLTERFFNAPYVRLKPVHVRRNGFNVGTHFRAAVLIHELSHIAIDTYDIGYVDSDVPFLDLIDDTGDFRARLKRQYQRAQNNLSHLTPREQLFRLDEDDTWRDLKTADGEAKGVILKLTDTSNLETARDKFLHDPKVRAKVILNNADSVTLLVTLLGRELF